MNRLSKLKKLNNKYFALRHGESLANKKSIIASNPKYATTKFGLTEKGREQVKNAVSISKLIGKKVIIYSSDFLRTKETAETARKILKAKPIILSTKLRERYFGKFDMLKNTNYKKVWLEDAKDSDQKKNGVESVNKVLGRITSLISNLEKKHKNKTILLVSHGDPLQILQTTFMKINPKNHRKINEIKVAEMRRLILV